ncbi:hypothetical protein [Sphingomonas sp. TREG-RG-20F-R18-01]|uniref:hypothetical protein n=1 Tax=Sphingomonas sp. TREG-RG-20F-R18-01 TaxID=2914982 RepID=UPI001F562B8B|nr:hypothetical protein [Sphingomonas sp. TREG-RG-20F-R18-01]
MTDWNATDMTFIDISMEASRTYIFHDVELTIDNPTHLHVSESGGHRIRTADGLGHYIVPGFCAIEWMPKEGQPTFVA